MSWSTIVWHHHAVRGKNTLGSKAGQKSHHFLGSVLALQFHALPGPGRCLGTRRPLEACVENIQCSSLKSQCWVENNWTTFM